MTRVMLLAGTLLLAGCLSPVSRPVYPAWPIHAPRVKLDRIVSIMGDLDRAYLSPSRSSKPLFVRPYDVSVAGEDLYVTDPGAAEVVRIRGLRKVRRSRPGTLVTPIGVAAWGDGVAVTDAGDGRVVLFDRDLRHEREILSDLVRPTGIARMGSSILVVETGRHRLLRLDDFGANGVSSTFGHRGVEEGSLNFPTAVAVGPDCIWLGDTLNFRLICLDPPTFQVGEVFGALGDSRGDNPRLKGIAVDVEGDVWVSDALLDTVSIYTDTGDLLLSLGGLGAGPGQFDFPAGISAAPDGRVVVVDSLNRRLQQFRLVRRVPDEGSAGTAMDQR